MIDEKIVASGLLDALENADIELRYRMPELFARVDALKATPGWRPTQQATFRATFLRTTECGWCGDEFVDVTKGRQRCCSHECSRSFRMWTTRRKRENAA